MILVSWIWCKSELLLPRKVLLRIAAVKASLAQSSPDVPGWKHTNYKQITVLRNEERVPKHLTNDRSCSVYGVDPEDMEVEHVCGLRAGNSFVGMGVFWQNPPLGWWCG
ncbi:hypothetical protein V6N12_020228 [Hibiscus sabdariffa]|uniref:Uncharacterized protein n=1 Tax=Hibiscus sabdariffa TaxID=183260 RepID=A0ABR2BPK7_9ROSI